jgi:hypothetical protein
MADKYFDLNDMLLAFGYTDPKTTVKCLKSGLG